MSKTEVREARNSGYDADFAKVYSQALSAVRELYPQLAENASTGEIKTSWHEVRITAGNQDPPKPLSPGQQGTLYGATTRIETLYFVRFTVRVVGGDPWRVSVEGQASSWDRTAAVPSELKGGDEPSWLEGRTNALRVAIHKRLASVAVPLPDTATKPTTAQSARTSVTEADTRELAGLPPGAIAVITEVLEAARTRNFTALGATMRDDFQWSAGASPSARTALAMWQADSGVLDRLVKAIEGGCRADAGGRKVACPPAAAEEPGYAGDRVGFEPGADQRWKMTFFVPGE